MRFIRARIHTVDPMPGTDDLWLRYVDDDGQRHEETFDMVVLSTGLEVSPGYHPPCEDPRNRAGQISFYPNRQLSSGGHLEPGIYACGAFTGPKDIPQSVMEASAAACAATENIAAPATPGPRLKYRPERDVTREAPRIGVFVCNCGINIGGIVSVPEVAETAKILPGVVYVEENLFTCSQDTQDKMTEVIREKGLNRVVVAACTPRTHEALFQDTLIKRV